MNTIDRGLRLSEIRKEFNLTFDSLGKLVGKQRQGIYQYEVGKAEIPIDVYNDLYDLYIDSYMYINGKTDNMFRAPKGTILNKIFEKLKRIDK